jgi:uncharacterized membrane protein YjjP (DUF1212 family)
MQRLQRFGIIHDVQPASGRGPALSADDLADYLVDLGGALLSAGCPTHRLEDALVKIAAIEGYQADAFGVPTGLFLSLGGPGVERPLVRMVRVKEWATDLERLALIDRVFNEVLARRLPVGVARRMLDHIEAKPPAYPAGAALLARALTAGAAAVFFRGGWRDIGIAAFGGLLVGITQRLLGHHRRTALLGDFVGAFLAAAVAAGASFLFPDLAREVIVLSVIILLVPGMALTTGLAELVHKNLVSGGAKLMEAMVAFLSIVFGIAVVVAIERLLELPSPAAAARGQPSLLMNAGALLATSAGFAVIFSVPPRLAPGALLTAAVGWSATFFGGRALPGSLTAFAAALSIALVANAIARLTQRPAQIFLLPALVLLVPGSFGFISLESFLRGDLVHGALKGFEMFLLGGAIVTGLLIANVVLPARKLL